MCKVSVVVPVYKVGKYIENSMKSVCMQTFKDFEVLLVDNNTPDESIEIAVNVLKTTDINYRVVKQTVQGLPAAREKGFVEAKGEWVVTIDPDDTISPDYLEILFSCAVNAHVDLVFCQFKETSENELFVFETIKEQDFSILERDIVMSKLLRRELSLMITNSIINKSLYEKLCFGFDKEVVLGADLIFVWRLLLHLDRIGFIRTKLYNHFSRADSLITAPSSQKLESNLRGYKRLCDYMTQVYSKQFSRWVYAREVYALLSVVSLYGSYSLLLKNKETCYSEDVYSSLKSFPDRRIVLMNKILNTCPWLFYFINKHLRQPDSWISKLIHKQQ